MECMARAASADVRFEATAVIGCVSSETARSRMTRVRHGIDRTGLTAIGSDHTVATHGACSPASR